MVALPHIRIVSSRRGRGRVSTAYTYEFEDVMARLLGAELVAVPDDRVKVGLRAVRHHTRQLLGLGRSTSGTASDLAIVVAQGLGDLHAAYAATDTIAGGSTRIAIIEELWPSDLPLSGHARGFLREFDLVAVGLRSTVRPLHEHLGVEVGFFPPAVDALAASAGADPRRAIDVFSMGRRIEPIHHRLLARAERTGQFYLYSTWSGNPTTEDHRAHRDNLRGRIRRSRYFTVQEARFDDDARVGDEAGSASATWRARRAGPS